MKSVLPSVMISLCLLSGTGFFFSCSLEEEVMSTAPVPLPDFDTIRLLAVFDVEVMEGDTHSLRMTASADALRHISYDVRDGILFLDNRNTSLWTKPKSKPPLLRITGKHIRRIDAEETCSIVTLNTITTSDFGVTLGGKLNYADIRVDNHYFYFWNSSPSGGHIRVTGKTEYLHIFNTNLMAVDAGGLISQYAIVGNGSKADVHIDVRALLQYSITGTGNIYLSGNPTQLIQGEITSSGRLIQ